MLKKINQNKNYTEGSNLMEELEHSHKQTEMKKADEKQPDKKTKKYQGVYLAPKKLDYFWEYPIYHKAISELQIEAMLEKLISKDFDPAQRKLLVYHYGLEDMIPKTMKETKEHFNLSAARARYIEEEGLQNLEYWLWKSKLMLV